ncbi:hypothetical protein ACFL2Q_01255 [Thermodesulfobacteriota bacterium]
MSTMSPDPNRREHDLYGAGLDDQTFALLRNTALKVGSDKPPLGGRSRSTIAIRVESWRESLMPTVIRSSDAT